MAPTKDDMRYSVSHLKVAQGLRVSLEDLTSKSSADQSAQLESPFECLAVEFVGAHPIECMRTTTRNLTPDDKRAFCWAQVQLTGETGSVVLNNDPEFVALSKLQLL